MTKLRKIILIPALILVSISGFFSCGVDRWPEYAHQTALDTWMLDELSTATARKYGLSLEVVDLHQEYWENVAAYAIDKVRQGLTPNPDVMCNKLIKFGCFERRVGKDFDFTATGHYATILQRNGKTWLGTAKDRRWYFPQYPS
mgnify:CR=1 FL=1